MKKFFGSRHCTCAHNCQLEGWKYFCRFVFVCFTFFFLQNHPSFQSETEVRLVNLEKEESALFGHSTLNSLSIHQSLPSTVQQLNKKIKSYFLFKSPLEAAWPLKFIFNEEFLVHLFTIQICSVLPAKNFLSKKPKKYFFSVLGKFAKNYFLHV